MIEAKLEIRMPETCAVAALRTSKAARVKLLDTAPHEMEGVKSLLQIESDACLDEVLSSISNRNVDEISKISDSNTKAAITVRRCIPARSIIEAGCFIKSAKHIEGGVEWDIIARRSSLIKLTEILEKNNYSFKIKRIGGLDLHKEIITNREMELLKYAVYQGYFDTPKNIGIRGVAKQFGISISTTSDMLRRGLKKILIDYFEGK